MKSFEEIYVLRTIATLKEDLNSRLAKTWEDLAKAYENELGMAVNNPDSPLAGVELIPAPVLTDNDYHPWSLEERPVEGGWAIVVSCNLIKTDANSNGDLLGQYVIDITILYQNAYLEGLGYAAVSRARKAVMEAIREKVKRLAYAGGNVEVYTLDMADLNKGEGDRTAVAKVSYIVTANSL